MVAFSGEGKVLEIYPESGVILCDDKKIEFIKSHCLDSITEEPLSKIYSEGQKVYFDWIEFRYSSRAINVSSNKREYDYIKSTPKSFFTNFAFVPPSGKIDYVEGRDFKNHFDIDGRKVFDSFIHCLREVSLKETWGFSEYEGDTEVLENYFNFMMLKAIADREFSESSDGEYICINTGLVDSSYQYIYVVLARNHQYSEGSGKSFWLLRGLESFGHKAPIINENFYSKTPPPPRFFKKMSDVYFDNDKFDDEHVNLGHVIHDGIVRGRIDWKFIKKIMMSNDIEFDDDIDNISEIRAREIADKIKENDSASTDISDKLKSEINRAKKKIAWNYKTAIPSFDPSSWSVTFLIPLSLRGAAAADTALAMAANKEGFYVAKTCLSLRQAYINSRLVSRPDSYWLEPDSI